MAIVHLPFPSYSKSRYRREKADKTLDYSFCVYTKFGSKIVRNYLTTTISKQVRYSRKAFCVYTCWQCNLQWYRCSWRKHCTEILKTEKSKSWSFMIITFPKDKILDGGALPTTRLNAAVEHHNNWHDVLASLNTLVIVQHKNASIRLTYVLSNDSKRRCMLNLTQIIKKTFRGKHVVINNKQVSIPDVQHVTGGVLA